jgi:hypothetical protein
MLLEWPRHGARPDDVVLPPELIVRASTRKTTDDRHGDDAQCATSGSRRPGDPS